MSATWARTLSTASSSTGSSASSQESGPGVRYALHQNSDPVWALEPEAGPRVSSVLRPVLA